jgi:two-component system, NarL family, nitrate/nitrite response regulator NarL
MIRVVLVDDHPLFRKGLAELLERDGRVRVVGIAASAPEARSLLDKEPHLVVVDLNMPQDGGLALIATWREAGIEVPVVALTVSEQAEDLAAALRAGARGYLLKSMEPEDVVESLLRVARGEVVVAPAMTTKLVAMLENRRSGPSQLLEQLTQREREILGLLGRGLSNKTIARELGISVDTVKLHVKNVLAKLSLTSRVEAAVYVVRQELRSVR